MKRSLSGAALLLIAGQALAAGAPAPSTPAQLVERGGCTACHGAGLDRPIDGATPRLAGQHADYLRAAMRDYKTDGNARVGRNHPTMKAIMAQFTAREIDALAEHIARLPGSIRTRPQGGFR